ncbi:phospholipase D-like domain-containing protein [Campylobacter estrildidarum]|uniref:restriction endonuclease PLD domain-containing protein n=1 Tax=Campylobacter estrildidarum TaxID=2510189 RepID=UPI0014851DFB
MIDFYSLDKEKKLNYANLLGILGSLSKLFSENEIPFLHYRIMENLFCSCFNAKNLSRSDTAYDAQINDIGIGLKTFICEKNNSIEKIAEFNKLSSNLKNIKDLKELVLELAKYRNQRIDLANSLYGINKAFYHIIARRKDRFIFFQSDYEKINLDKIKILKNSKSSLSFTDGINEYYFNYSKSVLQRKFYIDENYNELKIEILDDPFDILLSLKDDILNKNKVKSKVAGVDYVILPLYSFQKEEKYIPQKSGLNQWNASGRLRDISEIYVKIPAEIHKLCPNFFPDRDSPFTLTTPNNEKLNVKLCQQNSKALMSNPNKALANWLLRTTLQLKEGELATYNKLQILGFDSVIINKIDNLIYSIDIMPLDSYEEFIDLIKCKQK